MSVYKIKHVFEVVLLCIQFPAEKTDLFTLLPSKRALGAYHPPIQWVTMAFHRESNSWGVNLNDRLLLLQSLRMSGVLHSLTICHHGVKKDKMTFQIIIIN
jgi:hypothetical protein